MVSMLTYLDVDITVAVRVQGSPPRGVLLEIAERMPKALG